MAVKEKMAVSYGWIFWGPGSFDFGGISGAGFFNRFGQHEAEVGILQGLECRESRGQ